MNCSVRKKGSIVLNSQDQVRFEAFVLPHLDAALNLARRFLRSGADAEDASQEAMLRAYCFFEGFHGGDVRAWRLQIVRNTCFTWLDKNRHVKDTTEFDEELHGAPRPHSRISCNRNGWSRAPYPRPRVFAVTLSGGDRAPRARRVFSRGDCHYYFHSHRYSHVQGFPCPLAASANACSPCQQGGHP